jgi:serine/threonine-protein kinase
MDRSQFEARVGSTFHNKWKLEKLLGVGGMAAVYLARHRIGRVEAVKLLHPDVAVDNKVLERFEQEARAVNAIGHPGVVEVRDIDVTDDGIHFLVMELLDGETLADRYERAGPLELGFLLDIVDQLLDVLIACHDKGIIHRDIKPENLFIQRDGVLKVLDFGIARMREGLRTDVGTMLGTVAFSAPEQLRGGKVDARADLFSVGATLFTLIAGRRVHEPRDQASLALQMLTKPAPPLASVAPKAKPELCMLIDRALAFLPENRYPDARTMRGDVWAVRKRERPPYAWACEQAEKDAASKPSEPPKAAEPRADVRLPTTAPQFPAFLGDKPLPATEQQLPVFDSGAPPEDAPADAELAAEPEGDGEARERTKRGGFDAPHRWRTDPKWPVRRKDDDD